MHFDETLTTIVKLKIYPTKQRFYHTAQITPGFYLGKDPQSLRFWFTYFSAPIKHMFIFQYANLKLSPCFFGY